MADSEKLGPEGLGEVEDLNASKEVDALEEADVVAQTDAPVSDDVDADSQENAALEGIEFAERNQRSQGLPVQGCRRR